MNTDEIRAAVVRALSTVAPEADPSSLDGRSDLREALDIDSMDFLNFITAIHKDLNVDIPERDYPEVRTLNDCVDYLVRRLAA
jgi:acyl carrier protein